MIRTVFIAARSGRGAFLVAALVGCGLALSGSPGFASSDYPAGLFENSPVVGPDGAPVQGGAAAPSPSVPPPGAEPPLAGDGEVGPGTSVGGLPPAGPPGYPPQPFPPPTSYAGPQDDWCAGVASRIFGSLEELRRAHARCDRAFAPPAGY